MHWSRVQCVKDYIIFYIWISTDFMNVNAIRRTKNKKNINVFCKLCDCFTPALLASILIRYPSTFPHRAWGCGFTSCRYWIPQVPFCPCRLANLSPIWGMRTERTCGQGRWRDRRRDRLWHAALRDCSAGVTQGKRYIRIPYWSTATARKIWGFNELVLTDW